MTFEEILDQALAMLQRRGRVTYRALKRQFHLDDDALEDLKAEIIKAQRLAVDEDGEVLVWTGGAATAPVQDPKLPPLSYPPTHLAEEILHSKAALEGERKQVTVPFADIKDSTKLIRDLDPEAAQQLLDPALRRMMDAVHRYEGTVNQVQGYGIMALFGAPIAHEDHALRVCYAALAMQTTMAEYTEVVRRTQGLELRIRVGLNAGEVVVRAIGNDLHMDYSAVGQTTHLAARMEQLATPGSIRLTAATLRLVEGLVRVNALGPIPVRGLAEPVEVFELVGASPIRRRLQAAVARGLTRFVGRQTECEPIRQALAQAGAVHGQVVAIVGEAGVGKTRLVYEVVHAHHTQARRTLEFSRAHKERGHEAHALRLLGEVAAHRQPPQVAQAEAYYRQALALAEELGMGPLQAHCHHGVGTLYAKIGRPEQARTALSAAIELYRAMEMTFWLPQAEAALAQMA